MKKIFILFFIFFSLDISSQECSEFFLVRHAEKDRSKAENNNPKLNQKGKERSLKWAEVFKNIELDKIYSTNYYRTIETVTPISKKLNLDIALYSPSKINYKNFISKNIGNKVLVVGHSNTIPGFVNGLINEKVYNQINDLNNSNLYMVTICNGVIKHNLLYIE
jgi:2,3-bisphosphoglycerate-dependent phosphoglycerate mutase